MSLLYQIALTHIKGVGQSLAKTLLTHFGSAEAIFTAKKKELMAVPGIGVKVATSVLDSSALTLAANELAFVEKHKIKLLFWGEADYPKRLMECADAPALLYYRGNADLNSRRVVSMVGTRNATSYGKAVCTELVEALKAYDVLVVSGLAYGIDSYAHQASVKNEIPTVGVLGHGLDRIYPASNREMAAKMLGNGGLLTEYPSGTNPDREHFPERNRIIAGLADVTVVIEGALKGGALITAEIANNYNRDVCAFPGNIQQEFSAGCNYLIKTHRAHLVTGAKDLEYLMGWNPVQTTAAPKQAHMPLDLNQAEEKVYGAVMETTQIGIDALALKTGILQSKLAITLLELEMRGILIALPGKVYRIS